MGRPSPSAKRCDGTGKKKNHRCRHSGKGRNPIRSAASEYCGRHDGNQRITGASKISSIKTITKDKCTMQHVLTDKAKNRLYLKFSKMSETELAQKVIDVGNAVKKLKPGFTCLSELINFTDPSEKEKRMVRLVMEYLSMMGVSKVVRVGAKSTYELMEQLSQEAGGYHAGHANSIEEAEKMLDE